MPNEPISRRVASGEPTPDGVVLWTRLAPDPLLGGGMPDRPVAVLWEIASDDSCQAYTDGRSGAVPA